jgi:phenylpropionate dioxygenase-like ring-hydroxylating dioxygenase large terminal subunit
MYVNFWYAAALSRELGTQPLKVRMLGRHFVLFRDSKGVAHCLSNVCVHRFGSLAQGSVRGDHVACPYHGWEFDGAGLCQRIPSNGPDQPAPGGRARVDAYPTLERYGLVFAFLGDLPESERPPIMPIPEWDDPAWRCTNAVFDIRANYRRLVENALDFAHAEFVHFFGSRGRNPNFRIPDYDIVEHAWGAGADLTFERPSKGLLRHLRNETAKPRAGTHYHGPASFITRIHIDARMASYQYVFETPVDAGSTRSYLVNARNFFTSSFFDGISDRRNASVVLEDRAIVEAIEPPLPAEGSVGDLSVKADAIQLHYRRNLQRWQEQGWRLDTVRDAAESDGRRLTMIPSPARREAQSWVFDVAPRCG